MRNYGMMSAMIVGVLLVTVALAGHAGEGDKTSMEFRKNFIDEFSRTGLNSTPGDAMMLRILIESRGAKNAVEVGSFTGFGAINMGVALERTGGHLTTLEIDPEAAKACKENVAKVGMEDTVTCILGDALETLKDIKGPVDFVFIDAKKDDYMKYFKLLEPKLAKGAVIVSDNVIKSEKKMLDFLEYIQTSPDYDTVIIRASMEKGDGMAVTYKIR